MTNILIWIIALSQTLIWPLLSFRWIKEYSVQLLTIGIISYNVWKINKWVASFLMWSMMLFIISKSYLINDCGENISYQINIYSLLTLVNIVLYVILFYFVVKTKIDVEKIYKTFCAIAILQAVYIILQKLGIDQFFYNISQYLEPTKNKVRWPVALWGNESLAAWSVAICSAYFLKFKDLRFKIGYAVCFVAVLCTKTSAAPLAFITGFLFWIWFRSKKLAIAVLLLVSMCASIFLISGKAEYYLRETHRYAVWNKAIQLTSETPITGHGLGSFRAMFPQKAKEFKSDGNWVQAHNEYVQIYFEQGLIGLGIIICLIFTTFLKFFRTRRGLIPIVSLLTMFIIAIFGFPLHTAMGVLSIISLALFERSQWEEELTV